jgi:hypothetical protein
MSENTEDYEIRGAKRPVNTPLYAFERLKQGGGVLCARPLGGVRNAALQSLPIDNIILSSRTAIRPGRGEIV